MRAHYFLITVGLSFVACGDPTDRPEDCSPNEYFDEARKLCFSCPAVLQPTCGDQYTPCVSADQNGCPEVECVPTALVPDVDESEIHDCTICDPTEYLDDTLLCVACDGPMTCSDGQELLRTIADGSCTLSCR